MLQGGKVVDGIDFLFYFFGACTVTLSRHLTYPVSFLFIVDFGIHNLSILHFVKPVMVILHWRSGTEPMHSTTGTGMMMGKKYQQIL